MFRHHLVNLRGHERLNFDREGHTFLASFARINCYEQVFKLSRAGIDSLNLQAEAESSTTISSTR